MDCLHVGDHSRVATAGKQLRHVLLQRHLHCQLSEHRGAYGRLMTSMRGKRSPMYGPEDQIITEADQNS